jgi:hypothetical protein
MSPEYFYLLILANRNIDELRSSISAGEIQELKRFPGLQTQEEINTWHSNCRKMAEGSKRVQGKYIQLLYFETSNERVARLVSTKIAVPMDLSCLESDPLVDGFRELGFDSK